MKTHESRDREPNRREAQHSKKPKQKPDADTRHGREDGEQAEDVEAPRAGTPGEPRREQERKLPKRLDNPEPKQTPERDPDDETTPRPGDRNRRRAPEPEPDADTERRHFGKSHGPEERRGSEH